MAEGSFFNRVGNMPGEYETWLIPCSEQIREGTCFDVSLCLGQNLKPWGFDSEEDYPVYAIKQGCKKQALDFSGSDGLCRLYSFVPEKSGLYHILSQKISYFSKDAEGRFLKGTFSDNPNAVSAARYINYAHSIIYSGNSNTPENFSKIPDLPLQIMPNRFYDLQPGDIFAFTLLFKDQPLPLMDLKVACLSTNGIKTHEELISDGNGQVFYPINSSGSYFITARYSALESTEVLYYDTKYIYTFSFKVK